MGDFAASRESRVSRVPCFLGAIAYALAIVTIPENPAATPTKRPTMGNRRYHCHLWLHSPKGQSLRLVVAHETHGGKKGATWLQFSAQVTLVLLDDVGICHARDVVANHPRQGLAFFLITRRQ
jgi:hypothetical protein